MTDIKIEEIKEYVMEGGAYDYDVVAKLFSKDSDIPSIIEMLRFVSQWTCAYGPHDCVWFDIIKEPSEISDLRSVECVSAIHYGWGRIGDTTDSYDVALRDDRSVDISYDSTQRESFELHFSSLKDAMLYAAEKMHGILSPDFCCKEKTIGYADASMLREVRDK